MLCMKQKIYLNSENYRNYETLYQRSQMSASITLTNNHRLNFGFYFQTLMSLLGAPREFFSVLPESVGFGKSFGFLLISSLFFTGASLTCINEKPVLMAAILLINTVGMPFIAAGIGFVAMTMTIDKHVTFTRLFAVYAFATGVTLLASWIPLFVWLTEPWKWLLIAMGMVKGCGFKWIQAFLIIGLSIFVLVLFFWSLGPVIFYIKGLAA